MYIYIYVYIYRYIYLYIYRSGSLAQVQWEDNSSLKSLCAPACVMRHAPWVMSHVTQEEQAWMSTITHINDSWLITHVGARSAHRYRHIDIDISITRMDEYRTEHIHEESWVIYMRSHVPHKRGMSYKSWVPSRVTHGWPTSHVWIWGVMSHKKESCHTCKLNASSPLKPLHAPARVTSHTIIIQITHNSQPSSTYEYARRRSQRLSNLYGGGYGQ